MSVFIVFRVPPLAKMVIPALEVYRSAISYRLPRRAQVVIRALGFTKVPLSIVFPFSK